MTKNKLIKPAKTREEMTLDDSFNATISEILGAQNGNKISFKRVAFLFFFAWNALGMFDCTHKRHRR